MGIETIGTGLKTTLQTISGLKKVYAPNELPDSVNRLPAAMIVPGESIYHNTFDNQPDLTMRIILLLGIQDKPTAANRILDYIEHSGDKSIPAAVDSDPTLDGSCDASLVMRNTGLGMTNWGGTIYLSTEFEINIYT